MEDGEKQTGTREVETGRLLALLPEEVARMPHHVFETDTERIVLITAKENTDGTVEEYAGFAKGLYAPHVHDQTDSEFTIVTGTGVALIGDERIPYAPGTVLKAPRMDLRLTQIRGFIQSFRDTFMTRKQEFLTSGTRNLHL